MTNNVVLNHAHLLQVLKELGYPISENQRGVCVGFSMMFLQAILLGLEAEEAFFKRLQLIENYGNNYNKLKQDLRAAQKAIQANTGVDEQTMLIFEIRAFLDGVYFYQNNHTFYTQNLPPFITTQVEIEKRFSYISATELKETQLIRLLDKIYTFNNKSLEEYLKDLAKIFSCYNLMLPLVLSSAKHQAITRYNPTTKKWLYMDADCLPSLLTTEDREISTVQLVEMIYQKHSKKTNSSENIVLQTIVFSQINESKIEQLKESFDKENFDHKKYNISKTLRHVDRLTLFSLGCVRNHLNLVEELLAKNCSESPSNQINVNTSIFNDHSPLSLACTYGYHNMVECLLKQNTLDIHETNAQYKTAFHFACENGHETIVNILLAHHDRSNFIHNDHLCYGLHVALNNRQVPLVHKLLKNEKIIHALLQTTDKMIKSILHIACNQGDFDIIEELVGIINKHHDLNAWIGEELGIPLIEGVAKKMGIAKNKEYDYKGNTALHFAAENNRDDIIKQLLRIGLDPCITNDEGNTPACLIAKKITISKRSVSDLYWGLKCLAALAPGNEKSFLIYNKEKCYALRYLNCFYSQISPTKHTILLEKISYLDKEKDLMFRLASLDPLEEDQFKAYLDSDTETRLFLKGAVHLNIFYVCQIVRLSPNKDFINFLQRTALLDLGSKLNIQHFMNTVFEGWLSPSNLLLALQQTDKNDRSLLQKVINHFNADWLSFFKNLPDHMFRTLLQVKYDKEKNIFQYATTGNHPNTLKTFLAILSSRGKTLKDIEKICSPEILDHNSENIHFFPAHQKEEKISVEKSFCI